MKILNLFAGLGGNRKSWTSHEVTAIEFNPKIAAIYRKIYPQDTLFIDDALELIRHLRLNDFDFIWASPPCRTHSCATSKNKRYVPDLRSIYGLQIFFDYQYKGLYVIENVQPFYQTLMPPMRRIDRHLFWANFFIPKPIKNLVDSRLSHDKQLHKRERSIIMRGSLEDLAKYHEFDLSLLNGIENKETLLRNMTHWRIGEYILKCIENHKNLDSYI